MAVCRRLRVRRRAVAALVAATVGAVAIVGGSAADLEQRPLVHPLLPWHPAVRDGQGRLLAWYRPGAGLGYDRVLRLGWRFIEARVPRDRRTGVRVYLLYPVFDARTLQGRYWLHNPAFLYASFVDSLVEWYPYSGDRRAVGVVKAMLDYQLAHGTTPAGWAWPGVPFATSCGGERKYGRCLRGHPAALLRRHRARQGRPAGPWLPPLLRAHRREAVPPRRAIRSPGAGAQRAARGRQPHALAVPRRRAHGRRA